MRSLAERGFAPTRLSTWAALLLGSVFLAIGLGFAAAPGFGAALFGIEAADRTALAYVRALGFRDIALALYIYGLIAFGTARTLSLVLACSLVIPALDLVLVFIESGRAAAVQLAVHAAGAGALIAVALWLRSGPRSARP